MTKDSLGIVILAPQSGETDMDMITVSEDNVEEMKSYGFGC